MVRASLEEDKLSLSLLFLRERLNEIYDLLDQGERVDAINAFVDYMTVWEDLISEYGVELEIAIPVITEEAIFPVPIKPNLICLTIYQYMKFLGKKKAPYRGFFNFIFY